MPAAGVVEALDVLEDRTPLLDAGASYIADEWTIVGAEHQAICGLQGLTHLWSWHLRYVPRYWDRLPSSARTRFRLLRVYQRLYRTAPLISRGRSWPFQMMRRLSMEGGVKRAGLVRTSPRTVYAGKVWEGETTLDHVFLVNLVHDSTHLVSTPANDVATRVVASLADEHAEMLAGYNMFRFAFPERANPLIDGARDRELQLLTQAFAGVPAHELRHPYGSPLHQLFDATVPTLGL